MRDIRKEIWDAVVHELVDSKPEMSAMFSDATKSLVQAQYTLDVNNALKKIKFTEQDIADFFIDRKDLSEEKLMLSKFAIKIFLQEARLM